MNYVIKKLAPADYEQAKELFHFYQVDDGVQEPVTPTNEYLQRMLQKDDFHVIVALHDNVVVGGVTGYELEMYKESVREMFLYEIATEPAHKRNGIGRALIEALKKICREKGMKEMYVGAMADNAPAINFYTNTGGKEEAVAWFVYDID